MCKCPTVQRFCFLCYVIHCTSAIAAATTFRFRLELQKEALKEQQTQPRAEGVQNSRVILILDP